MALPIIEKIAAELVARLDQITTANGYEFDRESVTRPRRIDRDFTPRNYSIVVDQSEEQYDEEQSYPGNPPASAYNVTFSIYGFVRESDDATTSPHITENQMAAAIQKAITENSATWHSFDGNAIAATFGTTERFRDGDALPFTTTEHNGARVELEVLYRVSELDPFSVRN